MIDMDDYKVEVSCEYKGETYSVRDNGAIMRHPKKGGRTRSLDGKWTFGKKNEANGYMFFSSNIRVHQVVATAFWGHNKEEGMVVDHKDTNRCNNRAENLQWVTKLENALNNPITRRRIINICGSIEAFLKNPALLGNGSANSNFRWMRTVSEEEAAKCKANLERWSKEDEDFSNPPKGNGLGEWIFGDVRPNVSHNNIIPRHHDFKKLYEEQAELKEDRFNESLTSNVLQEDWRTPTEFSLCPSEVLPLETYYASLEKGKVFYSNTYGSGIIIEAAISDDKNELCVITHNLEAIKKWGITYVYILGDKYIHRNGRTFFSEEGVLKAMTLFQGKEWTGGDCIDDYC